MERQINHKMKTTSIGLIPEDWDAKALSQIGVFSKGKGVTRANSQSGDIPCVRYGEIYTSHNNYIRAFYSHISPEIAATATRLKDGDILFAGSGETKEEIGKAVAFLGVEEAYAGGDIIILSPNEGASSKYLGYVLNAASAVSQKASMGQGDAVVHIHAKELGNVVIPFPKLEEQEKIADALSGVDDMIKVLDEAIAKKRQIKEGLMQQLLTGKTRLPGFIGKWLPKNLGKSALIKARIGWQGLTTKEYLDSGAYYLITGTDFKDGRIDWKNCHYVTRDRFEQDPYIKIQKHDVLVSKDGTIGKVAYLDDIPGPGTLNSGIFVIRSKDKQISQRYLAKVFVSNYFDDFIDSIVAGSTIVHLYQKDIVKFDFMVPPSIEEQEQICDFLEGVDKEIICLESKRVKYASLKQGMMQELLTGKTRL